MTRLFPTAVACLSLAALPLAGCGSDSSSDSGSTSTPAPATDTAASDTGGTTAGGTEVSIKDIKFNPATVTAKAGTTVTWTNNDPVPHNVTAPQAGIDSGTIQPGKTFSFAVEKAGKIAYVCTIHPGQAGTITVTAG